MRPTTLVVAAFGAAVVSTAAQAQLTITGNPNGSSIAFTNPFPPEFHGVTNLSSAGGHVRFNFRGDYYLVMPRDIPAVGFGTFGINLFAGFTFQIGSTPVQLSNLTFTADGKFVNGGGGPSGTATPDARFTYSFGVYENIRSDPRFDPIMSQGVYSRELLGNGYDEYRNDAHAPSYGLNPVLGSGQNYHGSIFIAHEVAWSGVDAQTPTMVTTHEFGYFSEYQGYTLEFDWHTVPTPGTATIAAVGLLAARRRR